jgi:hypothetical protein
MNKSNADLQKIIEYIFSRTDYDKINRLQRLQLSANEFREDKKRKLCENNDFNLEIFYTHPDHERRKETIYYDLQYGHESKLAGTGLFESHFQNVFLHNNFPNVVKYIFPEIFKKESWNFADQKALEEFCKGIFDFEIPSYKEAIPIRLATYFYPEILLPIFKINHLENICKAFGFETNAHSYGDKLFIFNSFLLGQMNNLKYSNIIKQNMANQIYYTVDLMGRLNNQEAYDNIIGLTRKKWVREFYEEGYEILISLQLIR